MRVSYHWQMIDPPNILVCQFSPLSSQLIAVSQKLASAINRKWSLKLLQLLLLITTWKTIILPPSVLSCKLKMFSQPQPSPRLPVYTGDSRLTAEFWETGKGNGIEDFIDIHLDRLTSARHPFYEPQFYPAIQSHLWAFLFPNFSQQPLTNTLSYSLSIPLYRNLK